MKKRFLTLILSLVMVISLLPVAALADEGSYVLREKTCNHDDGEEFVAYVKEPTCQEAGIGEYSCNGWNWFIIFPYRCNVVFDQEIPALDHTEETIPAVAATCTATGLNEGKQCSVCEEILVEQTVRPALGHDWETHEAQEATCTEDGHSEYQQCKVCDIIQNKEVYPAGHKFENNTCALCGATDGDDDTGDTGDAGNTDDSNDSSCNHDNYVMKYTAPKCTDAGSQSFWCPDCNYEKIEILPRIDHVKIDKSYAATCTTTGLKYVICKLCDQVLVNEEIPLAEHNYVLNTCTVCGYCKCSHPGTNRVTYTQKESTCSEAGYTETKCTACNRIIGRETLSLKPHNHVNGVCTACYHRDSSGLTSDYQNFFIVG